MFSAGTGHRKINGILQTRPAKILAVKIQYIFGAKAPDVFSWLTFFDTCFRLEQAIEKSTEFCKQDLPRFWQLKYNIFLGPRPQMFFLCLLFRYLFSAGTVHRKINGILQTRPAKIQAVKIQHIFGPKAPDVFSWLTFFDTCFRPQQAIEKNNGILQTRPAKIQAIKIQYILGPKAPDVFSWLTFFDTCFRLEQAIEKSTEFCKQDLPRFWQLKYNIFLGPRPQMFFLGLLFRYLFSAGTVHRKINGILQTRPAKIHAVKIQHIFGPKAPDVFSMACCGRKHVLKK